MSREIDSQRIDKLTSTAHNSPARKDPRNQVSQPSPLLEPSISIDSTAEDFMLPENCADGQMQKNLLERDRCTSFRHHFHRTTTDWCDVGQVTIDVLADDILLCIFNVYVNGRYKREEWRTLVHVCRRWRALVFGSPHHLNIQLFCSIRTPVLTKLDIWPALPIVIEGQYFRKQKLENLIAAIKHNDRVCKMDFHSFFDESQLERVLSLMVVPFPALTNLKLSFDKRDSTAPVLLNLFLGRSATRLQHLELKGFSFPGLPDLLLSTTGLVSLELRRIPHSWHISPDLMVTYLSALPRLKSLILGFESRQSHPDRESHHFPLPTRTLLPALTRFKFEGANEYAEDLVTRIDTPRLNNLDITFFPETVFDISHLSQSISRHVPKFQAPDKAGVAFSDDHITATFFFPAPGYERFVLGILCDDSAGQLLSLIELCRLFFPAFAMVKRLYIRQYGYCSRQRWKRGIKHSHWLQLLHFFTDAKDLYISNEITTCVAPVLENLGGEKATEVLPALRNLFFQECEELSLPTLEGIEGFIAERELSGHPIAVSDWF